MTWPVHSLGVPIPSDAERSTAGAKPEPGVAQLIDLARLQVQHRPGDRTTETPQTAKRVSALPSAPSGRRAAPQSQPRPGWLGPVLLLVAIGVLGQAWIGYQGRISAPPPSSLWYLSLCLIFTPSTALIMSQRLSDNARIWLTLYTCLALLATRFMLYPTQFAYHDELINYRVLLSIENSRHLFTPNSLLPPTADYPGMQIATSAIHNLTGLSLHSAGIVILLTVRVVMTLALIRIIQQISQKVTVGCLASLIYAANPQYIFFNSQFAYQSVALPLCLFCIYVFAVQRSPRRFATVLPSAAVIVAIVATHHLTSLALVAMLWFWYLCTRITGRPVRQLFPLAVASLVIIAAWTWLARSTIVPYISEIAQNSITNITNLANGRSNHKFFTDPAGDRNPIWQSILAISSVLIITTTLMPALWLAIIKRRLLSAAVMVMFAIAAIYPMIPVGHLTVATAEVADRASGFVFVGLGYLIATWWFRDVPFHRHAKTRRFTVPRHWWLLALGLTICFVGGTVIGSGPDWLHGPGPYLVSADNRSVDQLALQAAGWEGQNLPRYSPVYTDRINGLLASVYGNQHVLTSLGNGIKTGSLSTLLLSPPTATDVGVVCQAKVEFLIADKRLASSLPHIGIYIDNGEYLAGIRTSPPSPSALTKFDVIPGVERVFDNGAIRIYDLRGLPCAGKS
jgi:hypothetical protein